VSPTNGARYGRAVNAVFVLKSDQNSDLDPPTTGKTGH